MAKTNFENLKVYELSELLSDKVWGITTKWDSFSKDTIGKQIVRSADSIGANIAEGSGRGSNQDYKRFIKIARGSLYETQHWLRRAFVRKLLTKKQTDELIPIIENLTRAINGFLRSIGSYSENAKT